MKNYIDKGQDAVQSAISYVSGGGMIGFASIAEVEATINSIASMAQAAGLVLGAAVVGVRLVHDIIALARFIRKRK